MKVQFQRATGEVEEVTITWMADKNGREVDKESWIEDPEVIIVRNKEGLYEVLKVGIDIDMERIQ